MDGQEEKRTNKQTGIFSIFVFLMLQNILFIIYEDEDALIVDFITV